VTIRWIGARWIANVAAAVAVAATWLSVAMTAVAASPTPQAAAGDPRSSGQGPGLVGDPAFALVAVLAIGLGSVLATLVYVRLTARRGS
jgi:hypothetical protein